MNIKKEIIIGFVIAIIIALTFLLVTNLSISKLFAYCFVSSMLSLIFLIPSNYKTNKVLIFLNKIFSFFALLPVMIIVFIFPILTLLAYISIFVIFTSIPIILLDKINSHYLIVSLSFESKLFIFLTYMSITLTLLNSVFLSFIFKILALLKIDVKETSISARLKKVLEYSVNPTNIRFSIYLSYFIYICIFSFNYLESNIFFAGKSRYTAIMQSFLTFLAYDSFRINSSQVRFLPSTFLHLMLRNAISEYNKIGISLQKASDFFLRYSQKENKDGNSF